MKKSFGRIYSIASMSFPCNYHRCANGATPSLVEHFAQQVCAQNGWKPVPFSGDAMEALQSYSCPGNCELRNMVERLMLLAIDGQVDLATVHSALPRSPSTQLTGQIAANSGPLSDRVQSFERDVILSELKRTHHNMSAAAKALGLERSHLYKKAEQLGLICEPYAMSKARRD